MLKRLFTVALFGCSLLVSAGSFAKPEQDPYEMVKEAANRTFTRIKQEQVNIQSDPEILRTIVTEELLPHANYQFAALKVLGKYFKTVPREMLPEYYQVFRDYLVTTYATLLAQYDDQEVLFEPSREIDSESLVTVRALIREEGRPDIKIGFRVRYNKKTEEWQAIDMLAEGSSVISAKQSEFEGVLRKDGLASVIEIMREKASQPISLPETKL